MALAARAISRSRIPAPEVGSDGEPPGPHRCGEWGDRHPLRELTNAVHAVGGIEPVASLEVAQQPCRESSDPGSPARPLRQRQIAELTRCRAPERIGARADALRGLPARPQRECG